MRFQCYLFRRAIDVVQLLVHEIWSLCWISVFSQSIYYHYVCF